MATLKKYPKPDYPAYVRELTHWLAIRERELLETRGPCTTTYCCLHLNHYGDCTPLPQSALHPGKNTP